MTRICPFGVAFAFSDNCFFHECGAPISLVSALIVMMNSVQLGQLMPFLLP